MEYIHYGFIFMFKRKKEVTMSYPRLETPWLPTATQVKLQLLTWQAAPLLRPCRSFQPPLHTPGLSS